MGTAELLEHTFESVIEKKSAIEGFGTKVKELEAAKQAVVDAVENEDETEKLMRQYGLGMDANAVIERYEKAMSAFDEEDAPVSCSHCRYNKIFHGRVYHRERNDEIILIDSSTRNLILNVRFD